MNNAFMITRHVHKNGELSRLISRKKTAVLRALRVKKVTILTKRI